MIKSVERSDALTLGTLDHFSHFTLNRYGNTPLSGATQSLALWAKILYSMIINIFFVNTIGFKRVATSDQRVREL